VNVVMFCEGVVVPSRTLLFVFPEFVPGIIRIAKPQAVGICVNPRSSESEPLAV
jgi:hypothetical protein